MATATRTNRVKIRTKRRQSAKGVKPRRRTAHAAKRMR